MKQWPLILAGVALVLLLASIIYPVYLSPIRDGTYDAFDDDWNDLSDLRNSINENTRTIITTPSMLNELEEPKHTVLFIIGMERDYSEIEVEDIHNFVEAGGKVILANNNRMSNPVSEPYGVKYYDHAVLDESFLDLPQRNRTLFERYVLFNEKNFTVRFNSPVGLEVEKGEVLCQSGPNSSLDLNDNGLRDLSDKRGPIPMVVLSEANKNGGRIAFICTPAVFVNQEFDEVENRNFSLALVEYLLDEEQKATGTVVSGAEEIEPLIVFDQSRHVTPRDRQLVFNSITILAYLSKHPILVIIIIINIICIGLFWWLANPRPKPYRHQDRLSEKNPSDSSDLEDVEHLREILLLRLLEAKMVQKDATILSSNDLGERVMTWKRKKVVKLTGDEDLADLLINKKKLKSAKDLKTKISRWEK